MRPALPSGPFPTAGSIAAAIGCGATTGVAFGLSLPLLTLRLDDAGHPASVIGLIAAAAALSTLIGTVLTPRVMRAWGGRRGIFAGLLLAAAALLLFPVFETPLAWFGLRVVFGLGITLAYVLSEAWLMELAPEHRRGALIGLYGSVLAGGVGLGALLVGVVGHTGFSPFGLGAAVMVAGALWLAVPGPGAKPPSAGQTQLRSMLVLSWQLWPVMLAPLVMGAVETANLTLLPVYVRLEGLVDPAAAYAVAIYASANVLMQLPLGLLADRIGLKPTLWGCAAAGLAGPLAVHLAGGDQTALYVALFIYSGCVTGIYTLGLVWLAGAVPPGAFVTANAGFALAYGLGMSVSPLLGGLALDAGGGAGWLASQALMALPFVIALAVRGPRRQA
jgi:MFS family permease